MQAQHHMEVWVEINMVAVAAAVEEPMALHHILITEEG
jgi:hypothetical protein